MWVSLQAAYDALAAPVRSLCDQLIAWHHDPWFAADVEAKGGYEWDGRHHDKLYPASHPVVRTHPETGRNGLFVNSQFTRFLEGVSPAGERPPCSTCSTGTASGPSSAAAIDGRRARWRSGTTGPPCTTRSTTTATRLRIAHRVTLRGDLPYGPARPLDSFAETRPRRA